jgi:tetratricopeptide (TPR) repeat protein
VPIRANSGRLLLVAALSLLLLSVMLVYWPGLAGDFLFDDRTNLALLGYYGVVDNWNTFWQYILSGFSGPTGRPVSFLSFLIDANHWPADPWPFKRTNLVIHCLVGIVLFGLLRSILRTVGYSTGQAGWGALLAAAIWLLHPFWVSTTLYVVQRMAQLAALFTLAGLWMWVECRRRRRPALDIGWVALGITAVWGFGLLALLSKENGALLPAFVLVLEVTVLAAMDARREVSPTRGFRIFRWILLGLPLVLVALFMARGLPALVAGDPGQRDFTPLQRLLTEGRILWDYIFQVLVPRPYPGGLFNDNIAVSTGLFHPWTTALAWSAWVAVVAFAIVLRHRYPLFALAVLFFLAGHLLESSFIQLELYFEHRSYLPAALFAVPIVTWWLFRARVPRDVRVAVPLGLLLALAGMTYLRADLWSSPYLQALKWAEVNSDSPRAQNHLAGFWWETGNGPEALRLNNRAIELDPDGLPWLMTRVMYECARHPGGQAPARALSRVETALGNQRVIGKVSIHQTQKLLDFLRGGRCGELSRPDRLLALFDRLDRIEPVRGGGRLDRLLSQRRAMIYLDVGRPEQAFDQLVSLLDESGQPALQLSAAAALARAGHYRLALDLLDRPVSRKPPSRLSIDRLRYGYLEQVGYYERERQHLRSIIRQDLENQSEAVPAEKLPALP